MSEIETEKTLADFFRDWESDAFGFGYGTGEPVLIPVIKAFFAAFGRDDAPHAYDYTVLEQAVGAPVAWLLINRFCRLNAIEYGTSPRYGWLTTRGERLRDYFAARTADELLADLDGPDGYSECYPDHCNCDGPKCVNPFWTDKADVVSDAQWTEGDLTKPTRDLATGVIWRRSN